jgi:hypothetical protein
VAANEWLATTRNHAEVITDALQDAGLETSKFITTDAEVMKSARAQLAREALGDVKTVMFFVRDPARPPEAQLGRAVRFIRRIAGPKTLWSTIVQVSMVPSEPGHARLFFDVEPWLTSSDLDRQVTSRVRDVVTKAVRR